MIVMKFGGTSVESREAIERVAGIVKAEIGRQPVVVVSAMGKTTNKLLSAAYDAAAGRRDQALATVEDLRRHHMTHGLALAGRNAADLDRLIRAHFEWLEELIKGLSVVGELSPRSMDAVASVGERLSSLLVSFAFQAAGFDAQHIDSRRVMVTDNQFTQAQPLLEETNARLAEFVVPAAKQSVVVMGGFIAATLDGETTTLGRGGSDYSASLIGAGIDAEEIQIWTDVDGMLTTDPGIVPHAQRVDSLSFAEAAELAYFGARVLHPSTVLPAIEKSIPVSIRNSRRPESAGTVITATPRASTSPVKAISSKRGVSILHIQSTRMLMAHGFLRRIFEIFDRYKTSVDMVSTSEVSVSLTVDDTEHLDAICAELRQFAEVSRDDHQAIICLVGENIRHSLGLAGRIFQVIGQREVRMISQGASLLNIGFVVDEKEIAGAVSALHAEFFSDSPTLSPSRSTPPVEVNA